MICQFIFCFFRNYVNFIRLPVSSDAPDAAIIHIADLNTTAGRTCMYDLSVANINTDMSVIADHIAREHLGFADGPSASCQRVGITRCGNTTCLMNQMYKSGTVGSIGQAVSSIYIRIAHIAKSCGCNGRTTASSGYGCRTAGTLGRIGRCTSGGSGICTAIRGSTALG